MADYHADRLQQPIQDSPFTVDARLDAEPSAMTDAPLEQPTTQAASPAKYDESGPKISKAKLPSSKPSNVSSSVVVLVACIIYFVTFLYTFMLGLTGVHFNLHERQRVVGAEFWNKSGSLSLERVLYQHLDTLQASSLDRILFETHPQCLARAVEVFEGHYYMLPYESYPDILAESIEWAENNCGRLLYAPQPTKSESAEQVILDYWSRAKYETAKLGSYLRNRVDLVGKWLMWKWSGVWPTNEEVNKQPEAATTPAARDATHVRMPKNFELDCTGDSICRLKHIPLKSDSAAEPRISEDELSELLQKWKTLHKTSIHCANGISVLKILGRTILAAQCLALTLFILFDSWGFFNQLNWSDIRILRWSDITRLGTGSPRQKQHIGSSLFAQIIIVLSGNTLEGFLQRAVQQGNYNYTCCIAAVLLCLSSGMVLEFLFGTTKVESLPKLRRAVKELALYMTGRSTTTTTTALDPLSNSLDNAPSSDLTSSIYPRRYSALATLAEDLERERQKMLDEELRDEQPGYIPNDSDAAEEVESFSDEYSDYYSEPESDASAWSVV